MTSNHNAKTCKQRLLCMVCKEHHPAGMRGYVKRVSKEKTESKDGTKHTVKCASVKGKLDTEIIRMCMVLVSVS